MTLEQLRVFVAVAERQHVTAAARALNLTQSATSAAVAGLERRHGVRLFHRVGRRVELTEAGRTFLPEARDLLVRAEAAATMLRELDGIGRGTLRVVASQTTAAYWLPPILARFQAAHPSLDVELAIANTEGAAARVRDGEADLGVVKGAVDEPALARWRIGEDRLVLVAAEPFEGDPGDPAWLRRARWVMRERGSGTRSTLDARLMALGIDPSNLDVAITLPSNESVRTAVEAGAGVAALSTLVVGPAIRAGLLHAAPLAFDPRPFFGLRHKERYASRAAQALIGVVGRRGRP